MEPKPQHKDLDYMKFIDIFNNEGRSIARNYVKDNITFHYDYFVKLVKRYTGYEYNRSLKKFEIPSPDEEAFMSIDDLLNKSKEDATDVVASIPKKIYYKDPIDELNIDILQDRLIEISKYIKISQSTKTIEINMIRLRESGYDIAVKN